MKSEFLKTAGAPTQRVSTVVMSGRYPLLTKAIEEQGIEVIKTVECPNLPQSISDHADMIFRHLGENHALVAGGCPAFEEALKEVGFSCSTIVLGEEYPNDCLLNSLILGDEYFCLSNNAEIPQREDNRRHIAVKQGYTACSSAIIDKDSIITADSSIHSAVIAAGHQSLKIAAGNITLDGYDYGFIGGCTGLISDNTLAITGELEYLSDAERIREFCSEREVKIVELQKGRPIDIGGIVPIKQLIL